MTFVVGALTKNNAENGGWHDNESMLVAGTLKGQRGRGGGGIGPEETLVPTLPQTFDWQMGGSWTEGGKSRSWMHDTPGRARSLVKNKTLAVWEPQEGASVRRLTPTECERLQALPDGWTDPTGDAPDSRRYAALGDAVTASVAEWIGRRIIAAEEAV